MTHVTGLFSTIKGAVVKIRHTAHTALSRSRYMWGGQRWAPVGGPLVFPLFLAIQPLELLCLEGTEEGTLWDLQRWPGNKAGTWLGRVKEQLQELARKTHHLLPQVFCSLLEQAGINVEMNASETAGWIAAPPAMGPWASDFTFLNL